MAEAVTGENHVVRLSASPGTEAARSDEAKETGLEASDCSLRGEGPSGGHAA